MQFIDVIGFEVKEGKMTAYQEWLRQNEKEFAAQYPEGTEYLGTFVSIYNSEKDSGSVFVLVRMDSYARGDEIAAMGSNETFARLMSEGMEFVDQSNSARGSRILLKALTDATVWN